MNMTPQKKPEFDEYPQENLGVKFNKLDHWYIKQTNKKIKSS